MQNPIKKFFSTGAMVSARDIVGELPDSKKAYGEFIRIAWPAMLETMFVSLAGFVDTMMVSGASDTAVAAVGITTQPRMLFFIPFFAIGASAVAIVSRRYGAGDREGADKCAAETFGIGILIAILLWLISIPTALPLLTFAGAKSDIIDEAMSYYRLAIPGMLLYSLSTVLNSAQRGTGRTKITMRSSVIGNAVNIVLNFFLINGIWIFPRLGVLGAAIATVVGQLCSFAVSLLSYFTKSSYLRLKLRNMISFDKKTVYSILKVGGGSGFEQLLVRIGLFMFAKVVAELGTRDWTTHQICMNVIDITYSCANGLGVASAALVGQNLGRGRSDISMMYGKLAYRVGMIFSVLLFAFYFTCGKWIMLPFTKDQEIIASGVRIMYIIAVVCFAQVPQVIFSGSLRGAGDTVFNATVSFFSLILVRPALAYVLCHVLEVGVAGAWIALLVDQYTRAICVTVHFYRGKWKNIKLA